MDLKGYFVAGPGLRSPIKPDYADCHLLLLRVSDYIIYIHVRTQFGV